MEPKVELLAPAGTWQAFETVIEAGADAVYLGGKRFNMRMHRKEFNFDNEQLRKAVDYAHERDARLYVTVNNLLSDHELVEMVDFLVFLDEISVDGVIIQDLAMLDLIRELKPSFEVHSSVMMNTSNLDSIRYLRDRGVTRVVTSREMTLEQIKAYSQTLDMEFEYFIHGDMCYAQSGQCIHSGILFGLSSNRGKCMKPCRWPFRLTGEEDFKYHLAVKDMCMFYNLREMIQSGVVCFKVEGRMRSPEYLHFLISSYRREIDRYLADPIGYENNQLAGNEMYRQRIREYSTSFAFGHPGADFIDQSGEREPRVFSTAIKEPEITTKNTAELKASLVQGLSGREFKKTASLTAAVPTFTHFEAVLKSNVERILIGGDAFRPYSPWTKKEIALAIKLGNLHGREVVFRTPSVIMEREMNDLKDFFSDFDTYYLRVMTGNIGVVEALYGADLEFSLFGDTGLNIFNTRSCKLLKQQGFRSATLSLEAGVQEVQNIGKQDLIDLEMVVQGPIRGMVSDNCLKYKRDGICKLGCNQGIVLEDESGCLHQVEMDQYCRNHVFLQNHLGLMPVLDELAHNGIASFRIEGVFYSPEELVQIIDLYDRVIRYDYDPGVVQESFEELQEVCRVPLTYGALVTKK